MKISSLHLFIIVVSSLFASALVFTGCANTEEKPTSEQECIGDVAMMGGMGGNMGTMGGMGGNMGTMGGMGSGMGGMGGMGTGTATAASDVDESVQIANGPCKPAGITN